MPFRFDVEQTVTRNLRQIATEQVRQSIAELSDPQLDRTETVHNARKRCKKIRGLLRLVRPSVEGIFRNENLHFRDAAQRLSEVRDADALVEAFELFRNEEGQSLSPDILDSIADRLAKHSESVGISKVESDRRITEFLADMEAALERIPTWKCGCRGFRALRGGIEKTYSRGCETMTRAADIPSDDNLHQWRKRAKYHWYHVRLLRDYCRSKFKARAKRLKKLSDVLGDDHDLAVLRQFVIEHPDSVPSPGTMFEVVQAVDSRRHRLQHESQQIGKTLYVESPKSWTRHLEKRFK
ncbi:CHAD domain protein [Planctomycetes bacterium CA13]|uniref:CHAD domain protein n=1 Tax=Novipirellula herctigrandis TaxID=2527986 RepID=A0A5C5ZAN2_9BACT|nr:CHAD domain protein [Planctomycetes bacterium CA13]